MRSIAPDPADLDSSAPTATGRRPARTTWPRRPPRRPPQAPFTAAHRHPPQPPSRGLLRRSPSPRQSAARPGYRPSRPTRVGIAAGNYRIGRPSRTLRKSTCDAPTGSGGEATFAWWTEPGSALPGTDYVAQGRTVPVIVGAQPNGQLCSSSSCRTSSRKHRADVLRRHRRAGQRRLPGPRHARDDRAAAAVTATATCRRRAGPTTAPRAPDSSASRRAPSFPRAAASARSPPAPPPSLKPCFAASRRRSSPNGTGRISPASPNSPKAISELGTGASRKLDRAAITIARSPAVSARRTPPTTLANTSWPCSCKPGVAMRHRQQHGEPIAVDADRDPARIGAETRIGQHLHFDQQRARSLAHHGDDAARNGLGVPRQKNRRRIRDLAQSLLDHGEHADLIGGAEAVLDRAQHAEAAAGIALEIQHRVDHVFEHARPGDLPFLGDVTDQQHRGAAGLGEAHQFRRALAQLRDGARRRLDALRIHGLNGIDDQHARRRGCDAAPTMSSTQVSAISRAVAASKPQAPRPQRDLLQRFLAGGVQHRPRAD